MLSKRSSLLIHSSPLILANISLALSGFIFWLVAARLYSIEELGLGSALISLSSLLVFISCLGIAPSFIRFVPENTEKGKLIATLFSFSLVLLFCLCLIFLVATSMFLPKLAFLKTFFYSVFFLIFVLSMQVFQILDSIYISFEKMNLVLYKNIIQHFLRIGFLFCFVWLGGFGIFSSNCLSATIALVISGLYFFFSCGHKFKFEIDLSIIKKILPFSIANFLNALSLNLPGMIAPLVILSLFSEREAGLFYVPWMIFMVYAGFIGALNSVFLMRASYGEDGKVLLKKTLVLSSLLGIAGIVIFPLWGDKILLIFKRDFSQYSFIILKVLFLSLPFFIINQLYITTLNIKKDIKNIGVISFLMIISLVVFTIFFLPEMKAEGIAWAWLISNFIGNVYIFLVFIIRRIKS